MCQHKSSPEIWPHCKRTCKHKQSRFQIVASFIFKRLNLAKDDAKTRNRAWHADIHRQTFQGMIMTRIIRVFEALAKRFGWINRMEN